MCRRSILQYDPPLLIPSFLHSLLSGIIILVKPAQMKEALKERGLDYQGNAKALQERLLKYESER